jgi:Optic atrophy 3 protein (OPA3)
MNRPRLNSQSTSWIHIEITTCESPNGGLAVRYMQFGHDRELIKTLTLQPFARFFSVWLHLLSNAQSWCWSVTKIASLFVKTLAKPISNRIRHEFSQYEVTQRLLVRIGQLNHSLTRYDNKQGE